MPSNLDISEWFYNDDNFSDVSVDQLVDHHPEQAQHQQAHDPFKALWNETVDTISQIWPASLFVWIKKHQKPQHSRAKALERAVEVAWMRGDFERFKGACKKFENYMLTLYGRYGDQAIVGPIDHPEKMDLRIVKSQFGCDQCDGFYRECWCMHSNRNEFVAVEYLSKCPLQSRECEL